MSLWHSYCYCRCDSVMDLRGYRGLSCWLQAGRIPRFAEVNLIVSRCITKIGIHCILEPVGLIQTTGWPSFPGRRPKLSFGMPWWWTCSHLRTLSITQTTLDPPLQRRKPRNTANITTWLESTCSNQSRWRRTKHVAPPLWSSLRSWSPSWPSS